MVNLLYSNPLPQPQFASLSILLQLDIPPQYSNNNSNSSDDDDGEIIHNISSDEIVALTNVNADAAAVNNNDNNDLKVSTTIVQLPDNKTREVPLYPKGLVVNYCQTQSSSASNGAADGGDDDDGAPTATASTTITTPATILGVHYDDTLEPYYTIRLHSTGMEKQTDNAHIASIDTQQEQHDNNDDDEEEVRKDEADKSAGPPTSTNSSSTTNTNNNPPPPPPPLQHTVLRETITIISPQTLLSERSHMECMDDLHLNIMKEYGLQDDFLGVGTTTATMNGNDVEKNDNDGKEQKEGSDDLNSRSATPVMSQNNSKVRFDNGTKGGAASSSSKTPSIITTGDDDNAKKKNCFQNIPIKVYQPNHTTTCGLGMTMYYLAVYAKDITKFIEGGDGNDGNDEEDGDDDPMLKALFRHCASVLVPGISGGGGKGNGGVIVLTVGSTGSPYDLFGASSIITTLPSRLREGMTLLSLVDTTTPNNKEGTLDSMNGVLQQQQQRRQTPTEKDGKSKFSFRGGKNSTPRSSQQKSLQQQQQELNNQSVMTTATYDSAYFKRLYMALLATILDDENGYMREHDDIVIMESVPFTPGSTTSTIRSPRTPSTTALLADQGMTSSGTSRKNRFTFSRKKNKSEQEYALDNNDANNENVKDGGGVESSTNNAGEIVRRMAQKLEVLSIADEEMPIPRYSHMIGGGDESNNGGGGAGTPRSRKSARIPGAASSSGRFGRPAVTSDLSGFEYRPSAAQQRMAGGGGGMSVSGFTTSTEGMSEDASVMTGDQSAYSASTQSSIPTLSRSKRDDSSTSSSSTRSRRFFFMKKKKSPKKKMGKQLEPLSAIPQDQELQPVYDPFGNDDGDANNATNNDATAEKGVFQSLNSTTVPLVREDPPPAPPPEELDVDDDNIKLSHSYESEGKESYVSGASTAPESAAEPEEEPTRHLDVSLALNEDLTCEYKKSKLSTLSVEGTIQVRMSTSYEGEVPQDVPPTIPFVLLFKDHSGHVRTLQENKKFVENVSHESEVANREFTYTITIPREEEYFPVVRYKCDTSLRPVPIVSIFLSSFVL